MVNFSQLQSILKPVRAMTADRGRFSPIGLDLGSSQIKLMQLQRKNGAFSIYRNASFPSPAGSNGELAETIQRALKENGCRGRRVIVSLHGQAATLRLITLPPLSPAEVCRAMRWEAERQLPLPAEESVYDYAFLDKRTFRGKTVLEFILAAAPRSVAENCTGAVLKAGYFPEAIEVAPLALRRAVHWCGSYNYHPCNGTVLVIHIGRENSDLLVLHRGRHRFYRAINVGINHLCK
ncbi:MAG TPA: pilus assembly protein PilM, partial [Bacillota bacterium]|nr:pilus assembly protein PilM [Bacillota bacterium]